MRKIALFTLFVLAATAALVAAITSLDPGEPSTYRLAIAADRTVATHTAHYTTTVELVGLGAGVAPLTLSGDVDFDHQTATTGSGLSPLAAIRLLHANDNAKLIDLGSDTVDGLATRHTRASYPSTGPTSSAFDAWVDRSGRLRQIQLVISTVDFAAKVTMRLRDFGHAVVRTPRA
jgi:hypothetical protein